MVDDETRRAEEDVTIDENLKYDRSGPIPIILVPQPSDDPNDPLVRFWWLYRTWEEESMRLTAYVHRIGRYGSAT